MDNQKLIDTAFDTFFSRRKAVQKTTRVRHQVAWCITLAVKDGMIEAHALTERGRNLILQMIEYLDPPFKTDAH